MRRSLVVVVLAAAALVLGACGGGDTDSGANTGAAVPTGGAEGSTIAVSLGEDGPDSMFMRLSQDSVAAGTVTFVVTNEGQKEHEFVVIQTDTPAGDFPLLPEDAEMDEEMGHMHDFDEEGVGGTVIDEVADLAAGDSGELTVTLEPGHYALVCNIRPHYQDGMWADFEVT